MIPTEDQTTKKPAENDHSPRANIANTTYSAVERSLTSIGWKITASTKNNLLFWCDSNVTVEFCLSLHPWQFVNHFPATYSISRKVDLAKNYAKMQKVFPELYDFHPKSFVVPTEKLNLQSFMQEASSDEKVFIIKPDLGSKGNGIFLIKNPDDALQCDQLAIAQQYIPPYLIDGLKFDFRVYALITSIDPLRVYRFSEGLARFCTEKYEKPNSKNLNEVFRHLTNYSVNKKNDSFEQFHDGEGHKKSITGIMKHLQEEGKDVETLEKKINDIIVLTIIAGLPQMRHAYKTSFKISDQKSRCFEILGFDIMLSEDLTPWLLEVNHSPSLSCDSQFDRDVKDRVISEAVKIVNIPTDFRKTVSKIERERAMARITGRDIGEPPDLSDPETESEIALETGWRQIYPEPFCKLDHVINSLDVISAAHADENAAFRKRRSAAQSAIREMEERANRKKLEPKPFVTSLPPSQLGSRPPTRSTQLLREANKARYESPESNDIQLSTMSKPEVSSPVGKRPIWH